MTFLRNRLCDSRLSCSCWTIKPQNQRIAVLSTPYPLHYPLEDGDSGSRMAFRSIETLAGVVESPVRDLFLESIETCPAYHT
jgi:hypothetical protein